MPFYRRMKHSNDESNAITKCRYFHRNETSLKQTCKATWKNLCNNWRLGSRSMILTKRWKQLNAAARSEKSIIVYDTSRSYTQTLIIELARSGHGYIYSTLLVPHPRRRRVYVSFAFPLCVQWQDISWLERQLLTWVNKRENETGWLNHA